MDYYYHIDRIRLGVAIPALLKKIRQMEQQKSDDIEFDSGFFGATERYIYRVYEKGREALNIENWTEDMIGTHAIADAVIRALGVSDNLDYFTTYGFTDKIDRDLNQAERLLFDLYKADNDTDDQKAFKSFVKYFGRNYSRTAYLYFLKDKEKFLPIKPDLFKERFAWLNIHTDCCNGCTWEHYQEFIQIVRDVQKCIRPSFRRDVTLLDAHSFLWCMDLLKNELLKMESDFKDYSEGEICISVEQWKQLLDDKEIFPKEHLELLGRFYLAENHATTCSDLAKEDGAKSLPYHESIIKIGKNITEKLHLPNLNRKDGENHYWPVLFYGRFLISGTYEWQMRPELVEAYTMYCQNTLISLRNQHDQKEAEEADDDVLLKKAKDRSERPVSSRIIMITKKHRDPFVSEWAKRRANGVCLLCGEDAPFVDKKGRPFLETHHLHWLSEGGKDSISNIVALCPNCHRKMHELEGTMVEAESRQFLVECVEEYMKREKIVVNEPET